MTNPRDFTIMSRNHSVRDSVRRALSLGVLAACGAGTLPTLAQQMSGAAPTAATARSATAPAPAKKRTAKTGAAKAPILLAQTTPAPPVASATAPAPMLQTIVVTGTMIARTEAETVDPVTIVTTRSLENQGIVNVEQAVDQITANVPEVVNMSSSVGSFSGGGSYANLRDLGRTRTLVLLDGERLSNNANDDAGVDLSGIPFAAISSIQVLRDGASSLYGSDAIAGVINFITKQDYQGAEVEVDYQRPQQAGGSSGQANFTIGHGDLVGDGYNVMLTANFTKQQQLLASQRSFSAYGFDPAAGITGTNGEGTVPGSITDNNGNEWQADYPACPGNPYLTTYFGTCAYRASAATDLIPEEEQGSAMLQVSKTLPANNSLRLQYFYTRSQDEGYSGPMEYGFEMTPQADPAYFPKASELTCVGNTNGGGPCTAPPDLTDPLFAFWTDPTNSRLQGNVDTEQRILLTLSGDNLGWHYTSNLNYSQNFNVNDTRGGIPDESLLAPGGDGVLSNLINPFGPQTAAGQALLDSSYLDGAYATGKNKLWSFNTHASHELGDAFNAGKPATVALGFQLSGQNFSYATTPLAKLLQAAEGFSPVSINGSRRIQAVYMELDAPITKALDLDISDREDRYSDFGTTNNGKVALRWQPSHFVAFRADASTGFRAPTLFNLFEPNQLSASDSPTMGQGNPLCQPGSYSTEWSALVCNSQGIGLYGGNRNLQPETSQNFDLGVILSPLPNLGITIDYYRILIKNYIQTIPASTLYGNPNAFPSYFVLNSSGTLTPAVAEASQCPTYSAPTCGYLLQDFQNTGGATTDGIDISIKYLQHTAYGVFSEDLEGTAITQYLLTEYTGAAPVNLVGWFDQGQFPAIRWQHNLMLNWASPAGRWGAGLENQFFSRYIDEFATGPTNSGPARNVSSQSTWDAYASYKPIPNLTVLFGVQNVLNATPPFSNQLDYNFAAGYSSIFSNPIMRAFYINLKYTLF
ncbi:MAG TPA: TonB-dependent receptor [Steroidobacteraceae bacterium]|nr:TonB-dependent receptor [Steroidobacteraceae bacterium]